MNKPTRNININFETFEGERASKSDELQNIYDLMRSLHTEELDSTLIEIMQVLPKLIQTKTISIYYCQQGSCWLRLMDSLNEESVMGGKSWNVSENTKIFDAIKKGEVYQGMFNDDEPDIIIPIIYKDTFTFVIVMKSLPYKFKSFYYINLLKVISLLLECFVEKTLLYEEMSKEENYIENTEILNSEAFKRRVSLAQEKLNRNMSEYCVVEIMYKGSLYDIAEKINKVIRVTDCLGIDDKNRLFMLLSNTNSKDSKYLRNRILECGAEDMKLELC